MMLNNSSRRKKKLFKIFNASVMVIFILNMSLGSVFFVGLKEALASSATKDLGDDKCKLELTKIALSNSVEPGEELNYQISLENVGSTTCEGTCVTNSAGYCDNGIPLLEFYDDDTSLAFSDPAVGVSPSIFGADDYWNMGIMDPGDKETLNLRMDIDTDAVCDENLKNKVCVFAKGWNNFSTQRLDDWLCEVETPVTCSAVCGNGIVEIGEECDDANNFDGDGCNANCTKETVLQAYKVVCEDESYLPNWGTEGIQNDEPSKIASTTAQDFIDNSFGHCWLEDNWAFEWGWEGEVQKQDGDYVGKAPIGSGWKDFDSATNLVDPAVKIINDLGTNNKLWVREVFQEGYLPFANPPASLQEAVSAEFYCEGDILNYDNYDSIDNLELGKVYNCVAFNALEAVYDFGDAPDTYSTVLVSDGARHKLGSDLYLGASVDHESDGQASISALGDAYDEDGVEFTSLLQRDYEATVVVNATAVGNLNAWIDFDQDGLFSSSEQIFTDEVLAAGDNNLNFEVPGDDSAVLGETYARFRFSSETGLSYKGEALDGEVEDYKIEIEDRPLDPSCGDGIIQAFLGEECDDGVNGSVTCSSFCKTLASYCGDGVKNQDWEECDGLDTKVGETCTDQCQFEKSVCDDKMFARFNAGGIRDVDQDGDIDSDDGVLNGSEGNMTDYVFLGSSENIIPSGAWFYLGSSTPVLDADIASYEDVPGLAVQRLDGQVRAVLYGSRVSDGAGNTSITEHINGNFEFFNANVVDLDSDVGNNILEQWSGVNDQNGVGSYNAGNDAAWLDSLDNTKSYFWLTTTTEDDGFYSDYEIIDDCAGEFTVCKYQDFGVIGDFEVATDTPLAWDINVANESSGYNQDYTTDATSGCYTVDGLSYGNYKVTEASITGGNWVNSFPTEQNVEVSKNSPTDDVVFLNYQALGSIEVCKYNDKDADGVYDSNDSPLAWDINISGMGTSTTVTTSESTGCATVDNLVHGDYTITEASVSGWQNSAPGTGIYNVTLDTNNFNIKKVFLNYQPEASIQVCKFNDFNYNGVLDTATDTPMEWGINIKNSSGSFDEDYTTASTTGCVIINNLEYDTYTVTEDFDTSSNWVNSKPGNYKYDLTLTSTSDYKEAIFLNYQKMGRVKVCKYEDAGIIGAYEEDKDDPLAWNISIKNSSDTEVFASSTDATTGCVVSDLLPYGDYTVSEEEVSGWKNSTATSTSVTIDSLDIDKVEEVTFLNYQPSGTISGHKYNDANRNGVIDAGEEVMAGVKMQLVTCVEEPLSAGELIFKDKTTFATASDPMVIGGCYLQATTTTAVDGSYSFTGLNAGDYGVAEVVTGNWAQSFPADNKYYYFNLGVNEATSTIDFANYINPGSITVCKKMDANGKIDTPDNDDLSKPEEEWEFTLSQNDIDLQTASTSLTDGCVTFSGLDEGDYKITETVKSGYRAISPGVSTDISLVESEDKTVQFVNYKMPVNCEEKILGYKYHDWTDEGLEGWEIKLSDATGAIVGVQTTDKNGYFEFDNLCVGQYILTETQKFGWEQVQPGPDPIDSKNYQYVVNVYGISDSHRNFRNRPTIYGCKYNDANNNGVIDTNESKLGDWEIQLYECVEEVSGTDYDLLPLNSTLGCNLKATSTTEVDRSSDNFGCYEFNNLEEDKNYYVREVNQSGWTQTYPMGAGAYEISYGNTNLAPYDFANNKDKFCGDGVCDSDESCSTCASDCGSCGGGGGGGGGGSRELRIINPQVTYGCEGATISWLTNKSATTRVVYDTISHPNADIVGAPNYGYASSSELISKKTTGHSVTLTDLVPGETYYFRPISSASPEKIGIELEVPMMPTDCCENPNEDGTCIIVKGEEAEPILEVKKENALSFANPGDKNIEYIVRVSNNGNLDSYNTILVDTLPEGLVYSDTGENSKTWELGDLAVGETKAVTYLVNVLENAETKIYTNEAVASATNHEPVSDQADLEILEIKVLAETGFDKKEFLLLTSLLICLVGASIFLKRRVA